MKTGYGTLHAQHVRTNELLRDIAKNQDLAFVVAFLHDAQYDRKQLGELMEVMLSDRKKLNDPR